MTQPLKDLILPNNIRVPAATLEGFLWGGRESGTEWLEHVPTIVADICQKHTITNLQPSPEMRMNLVLFGDSATHGPIVLKLAQLHPEVSNEINCMKVFSDTGRYSQYIDADLDAAWSMQTRIFPGEMLQTYAQSGELSDEESTRIAATLMKETIRPVPVGVDFKFPDMNRWLHALWEHHRLKRGTIPDEQLELAVRLGKEIVANPGEQMLLHGDFHHGNILTSQDGWSMIDPKGIVGPTAFEVGPFFYNPLGLDKRDNLEEIFTRRLSIFEEILGIDRATLWQHILVAVVLSDCWNLEDGPAEYTHWNTITNALMNLPERNA